MTTLAREIPPPTALEATLRKITEVLAKELACPTQHAPGWSDFEWCVARAVAAMHGVSPLLSQTLRWQGPASWVRFLVEQRAHTAKRHMRIDALLDLIDRRAREAGVAAIALKGAALHELGVYKAGDRPMADIDLLVRPADAEDTAGLLKSLGFHESGKSWKERVFTPIDDQRPGELGEHSNNNIKIELHERICERLPWRITDLSELLFPPRPHPGLNAYSSKSSLMTHLLFHAAGAMPTRTLRLLHLHDLAKLSSRMTAFDWDEVVDRGERGHRFWWAFPPMELTSRYYPSAIPSRVLASFAQMCPWLLTRISLRRTLYDVSLSYLWVEAFPGIEWSQSIRELLNYTASRVWPSTQHVAQRELLAKTEGWGSQGRWTRLSQSRRVVRWMTSHPPRPVTMHALRAALARAQ